MGLAGAGAGGGAGATIGTAGVMISLIISTGITGGSTRWCRPDCTAHSTAAWQTSTPPAMAALRANPDGEAAPVAESG